jgi:hypothetical protein
MIYDFPTIIVDSFFKEPMEVRKFALGMKYEPSSQGIFSGKRTESLHHNYPNFFKGVCKKILNCHSIPVVEYKAYMHFHTTCEEFGDVGWVHHDGGDVVLAAIVYLNINCNNNINNGTSLYRAKNLNKIEGDPVLRKSFIEGKDYKEEKNKHNSDYEEVIRVGEAFNRLISYDSFNYHTGAGYYGNSLETSRLTLLVFFEQIIAQDNKSTLRRAELSTFL